MTRSIGILREGVLVTRRRIARWGVLLGAAAAVALSGCATTMAPVSQEEIPALRDQVASAPEDASLRLRYAAAHFAAGDCAVATREAELASAVRPQDPLVPLIVGQCMERDSLFGEALDSYRAYLSEWSDVRGAVAIRAREHLAARAAADQMVAERLRTEATLGTPDPEVTAVLPVFAGSGPEMEAIAAGLSTMIQTDLSLLERLRLVERAQMQAVADELALAQSGRVAASTAPRLGRLVAAGRLIQGLLVAEIGADAALNASILASGGGSSETGSYSGRFDDLLRLQKELVLEIIREIGYVLNPGEAALVRDSGTENVRAFLAFADGMLAQDRGIYPTAIQSFSTAVGSDPGWSDARQRLRTTVAVEIAVNADPGDITTIAEESEAAADEAELEATSTGGALANSIADIASLQGETATRDAGGDDANKQIHELPRVFPKPGLNGTFFGVIRILLSLPRGEQ